METIRSTPAPKEVAVVDSEVVKRMRELVRLGWGGKAVVREPGVSRNTVRRYLRLGEAAEVQVRPGARRLNSERFQALGLGRERPDGAAR